MNRNIVVTGGSGGIGRALAERFLSEGDYVFLSYLTNEASAREIVSSSPGGMCGAGRLDLSDKDSIASFIEEADRFFIGRDRILINNAGISFSSPLISMAPGDIERLVSVNLTGTMILTSRMLAGMNGTSGSGIINITSVWGERAASCESVYAASKAGLEAFTRSLAKELTESGIRVNAIAAGFIDTPMNSMYSQRERDDFTDLLSVKRAGTPSDVASAASFLASEESSYINGQILHVDGGYDL